jgi:hypothetical protein
MVSDVRVAQNIGFKFQVIQPVLNDIANADDPRQLPVVKHRHVAHAVAGHQFHHPVEIVVGSHGDQAVPAALFTVASGATVVISVPFSLKMFSTFIASLLYFRR